MSSNQGTKGIESMGMQLGLKRKLFFLKNNWLYVQKIETCFSSKQSRLVLLKLTETSMKNLSMNQLNLQYSLEKMYLWYLNVVYFLHTEKN